MQFGNLTSKRTVYSVQSLADVPDFVGCVVAGENKNNTTVFIHFIEYNNVCYVVDQPVLI